MSNAADRLGTVPELLDAIDGQLSMLGWLKEMWRQQTFAYFASPSLGQYGLVRITRETGAVEYLDKRVVEIGGVDSTVYFWHALPMES